MDTLKRFFRPRLRVVNDEYLGFEAQYRYWWCPFWFEGATNTFSSLEAAMKYAQKRQKAVLWEQ